eukprot:GHVU01034757.1.p1 GENE.GHVU01034757.1~~GHVU01034757.1.p1  ORF type:complete len:187 (+),score=4.32 GHVU01034757.1:572-1132(+)
MRLIPLFLTVAIWRQSLVGGMTSRPHILVSGGRRGCGGAFQGLPSRGEERRFGDRGACSAISRAAPSSSSQYLSPSLTFNYVADHPEEILEVLKRRAYVDGQGLWTRGGGNVTMALSSFAGRCLVVAQRNCSAHRLSSFWGGDWTNRPRVSLLITVDSTGAPIHVHTSAHTQVLAHVFTLSCTHRS